MALELDSPMPASKEVQHRPHQGHKPYNRAPKPPKHTDLPKTSAITKPKHAHSNLTLSDWLGMAESCERQHSLAG
ncbi:hypothetical protein BJV78DRAFT_1196745 [Lactifluus subvellereus]|nr:hypothetical protein BJV78DRAFT_1196745 [Lactifluus subvellereus]